MITVGYKEVRFKMGVLRTSDPEVNADVRKAIKNGDTITEDEEAYLSKVQSPALRAERLARKAAEDRENLQKKDDEVRELEEMLAVSARR